MIENLIDRPDVMEVVRDQIFAILSTEIANQMVLAGPAAQDYKLRIFRERTNTLEQYLDRPQDTSPVVNVRFDNSTYDLKDSNIVERQKCEAFYNIDCYGYGVSKSNIAGDSNSVLECHKALRLCRSILMAAEYTYLGLQGTVFQRWVRNISMFELPPDIQSMQRVVAARLTFGVSFNEFSPQIAPEVLESIALSVQNIENDATFFELTF